MPHDPQSIPEAVGPYVRAELITAHKRIDALEKAVAALAAAAVGHASTTAPNTNAPAA